MRLSWPRACTLLIIAAALGAASSCCSQNPVPSLFGVAPDYKWTQRSIRTGAPIQYDPVVQIEETVYGTGPFQEYSYKHISGALSTCAEAEGYSAWFPSSVPLSLDLSEAVNGEQRLCLVGRGTNSCGELKLLPYASASEYRWILSAPIGAWQLSSPAGVLTELAAAAAWTAAERAERYKVFVSTTSNCGDAVVMEEDITELSATLHLAEEGAYFLCGEAYDSVGNSRPAENNGLPFKVFLGSEPRVPRDSVDSGLAPTRLSIGSHRNTGLTPWIQLPLVTISSSDKILLTEWSAVMDGSRPTPFGYECGPRMEDFERTVRVWSSVDVALGSPSQGDLANFNLTSIPLLGRERIEGVSITGCPLERITIDLSHADLRFEAGRSYVIAMELAGLSGENGVWGMVEAAASQIQDIVLYDDLDGVVRAAPISSFDESESGSLAVQIRAMTIP